MIRFTLFSLHVLLFACAASAAEAKVLSTALGEWKCLYGSEWSYVHPAMTSNEVLKVSGLKAGHYLLLANDRMLGYFTDAALAAGVDLAKLGRRKVTEGASETFTLETVRTGDPVGLTDPILLWPDGKKPFAENEPAFGDHTGRWQAWTDVTRPRMFYFPSTNRIDRAGPRPALLICPGGGYFQLSTRAEGTDIAHWANSLGYHAFVLLYRTVSLGEMNPDGAHADAEKALETIRARAAEWRVDPNAVGMIGFSAGANLTARTCCGKVRPNFALTIYPYWTEEGSNSRTSHPFTARDWFKADAKTPPCFIMQAQDDGCRVESALTWYIALKYAGVPAELHLFPKGGHGYGLATRHTGGCEEWPALAAKWMTRVLGKQPFLAFNDDDTHPYGNEARVNRAAFEAYIDNVCRGRVTDFFICANAQTAVFSSRVFDPCWKNYRGEPEGYALNLKRLEEKTGKTALRHWIEICRARNIRPWVSMRMNDVHDADKYDWPLCSTFWREHPDCWTVPVSGDPRTNVCTGWSNRTLDYSKKPVYDYHLAFVRELVERFGDAEGLELDWLRWPNSLPRGRARELHHVLTDFVRDVRKVIDAAAKDGRRMKLAVRVPSNPERSLDYGLYPEEWAKEKLVDLIIPANYKVCPDYLLPYADWCRRIHAADPSVRIVPCTDSCLDFNGTGPYRMAFRMLTTDEYCGWADSLFAEGATDFYLYNLYENPQDSETWNDILTHGFDPDWVKNHRRRYPIGYLELRGAAPTTEEPLPVVLAQGTNVTVRVGTPPAATGTVSVFAAFDGKAPADFAQRLSLNGVAPLRMAPEPLENWLLGVRPNMPSAALKDDPKYAYRPQHVADSVRLDFPPSAVRRGLNAIAVRPQPGDTTRLMCMELEIGK